MVTHRLDGVGLRTCRNVVARRAGIHARSPGPTRNFRGQVDVSSVWFGCDSADHDETTKNDAFDERRVGLDHLAFRVTDQEELQRWATHLDSKGVVNTGVIDTGFGPTIVFRDPDNMQLEFYVQADVADMTFLSEADSEEAQRALRGAQ